MFVSYKDVAISSSPAVMYCQYSMYCDYGAIMVHHTVLAASLNVTLVNFLYKEPLNLLGLTVSSLVLSKS